MPLSQSVLPSVVSDWDVPFDVATAFANGQTLAASGYINALQTQVDIGVGRWIGKLCLDISALDAPDVVVQWQDDALRLSRKRRAPFHWRHDQRHCIGGPDSYHVRNEPRVDGRG